MTDPQALRALVAKWREISARPNRPTGFLLCADDLDALLAREAPAPVPESVSVHARDYSGDSYYEVMVGYSYKTMAEAQELHARVTAALETPAPSQLDGPAGGATAAVLALLAREALTPAEEAEDAADARELSEAYRQHETAGLSRYPIPYAGAGGGTAMRDEPAVTQAARAVLAAVERGADPTQWFDALAVLRGAVDTADALLAREAPAPATPALIRYGVLHHTEGELYSHAPMADGYWTPWHFAQATIADLEARVQAAEAKVEALQAALQEAYVVLAGLERGVLRALDTGEYQTRDLRAEVEARLAEWSKPSGTPLVASGRVAAYHDVLALLAQAPEVNWKAPR